MNQYVRPHRDSAVLLTIDVQNDFTLPGAPAEIDGTAEAVPRMRQLVETFRSREDPVVHVVRLYEGDGSNVDRCRRADVEAGANIVRPGTDGSEVVAELKPSTDVRLDADRLLAGEFQEISPSEHVLYKPRWGAFYRTALADFLESRSVDTVVVCGCNFPNCPRTTVYEASERDFRVVFVPDATSGVYERGVRELENIGVAVKETDEAVEWITA
jgi:nicotinamidase-related amidase